MKSLERLRPVMQVKLLEKQSVVCGKQSYSKCIYNDHILSTEVYSKTQIFCDSYVMTENCKIGSVQEIFVLNNECYIKLEVFEVEKFI